MVPSLTDTRETSYFSSIFSTSRVFVYIMTSGLIVCIYRNGTNAISNSVKISQFLYFYLYKTLNTLKSGDLTWKTKIAIFKRLLCSTYFNNLFAFNPVDNDLNPGEKFFPHKSDDYKKMTRQFFLGMVSFDPQSNFA